MTLTAYRTSPTGHRRGRTARAGAGRLDPATVAYAKAVGGLPAQTVAAFDRAVGTLKAAGVWPKIRFWAPMLGPDLNAALVCAVHPRGTGYRMTAVSFVAADYVATGLGSGLTGDASTKYVKTGFWADTHLPNAAAGAHQGVYVSRPPPTTYTGNAGFEIGCQSGNSFRMACWGNNNKPQCLTTYAQVNSPVSAGLAPFEGLWVWTGQQVIGQAATTLYRRGVSQATATASGVNAMPAAEVYLFVNNSSGSPGAGQYSGATLSGAVLGDALTAADALALSRALDALYTTVGRVPPPVVRNRPYTLFLLAGQSLACGQTSIPPLSLRQTGDHRAFQGGPQFVTGVNGPITIGYPAGPLAEGNNNSATYGETVCSAFAALAGAYSDTRCFVAGNPVSGQAWSVIGPGTVCDRNQQEAMLAATVAVRGAGGTAIGGALLLVHGEADATTATYGTDITSGQATIASWMNAITGRSDAFPIITSQCQSWTSSTQGSNLRTQPSDLLVLAAAKANPTTIWLACPKYLDDHNAADGVHLGNAGEIRVGLYYAKCWLSGASIALWPLTCTRSGANVTVVFNKGGLVIDTTAVPTYDGVKATLSFGSVSNNVTLYRGFEFVDDTAVAASANITGHSITTTTLANDTVVFTLDGAPTGANKRLRGAYTGTAGAVAGKTAGIRTNLRDSDTSFDAFIPAQYTALGITSLPNWCVSFDMDAS